MAVVDAMGLLADDKPFVHESLIGHDVQRAASRRERWWAILQAIVPEIEGSAWITGEHTFVVDAAMTRSARDSESERRDYRDRTCYQPIASPSFLHVRIRPSDTAARIEQDALDIRQNAPARRAG